jgi:glycosyltransferase involved in cell wall biosynthesis
MLLRRLYYNCKPFIPRRVRLAAKRTFARHVLKTCGSVWPSDESAGRPPAGWPGWPEGKQFAFVLTHDVEGQRGLDRVKQLAEVELSLGFRSSFNLIPEGDYQVPAALRTWLTDRGFEVGVHDLHHDGKLYASRENFRRKAEKINQYLKDWNAVGFRSGFMLRNLDWLGDLNIQYDGSTFDTDPFEPQPDGAGTIFPFWVPKPTPTKPSDSGFSLRAAALKGEGMEDRGQRTEDEEQLEYLSGLRSPLSGPDGSSSASCAPPSAPSSTGYVELPYTLAQDSTLFLLLGETTPDIWLKKLAWVAERGGLAMLIVHPDYIRLPGEPVSSQTFPIEIYRQFLQHVRDHYIDRAWHVLPRQVAAYAAEHKESLRRKQRRVCMLAYSHYRTDARVTRYAEALADRGDHVDVIGLRKSADEPVEEQVGDIRLFSPNARVGKKEQSALDFLFPLLRFLFSSMVCITRQHSRRPYDILHIHNMPDFLVFAAWYPRMTGARIILDIHDIVPELYGSKFRAGGESTAVKMLKKVERISARFAHHVIISNHLWYEKFAIRTHSEAKCSVFINNVDASVFHPRPRTRQDDKLIILFPGGLQWHQGLDIALRAFQQVIREFPKAEFHIYGDGIMKPSLIELSRELGFNGNVQFFQPLPVKQIADIMANADLGVVPKRADTFGNEAYSTKIMEFMSVGVPVVVSSTKIDRFYFDDSVVRFFNSGDHEALAAGMLELLSNRDLRQQMTSRASEYAAQHCWDNRKGAYLNLVDTLCHDSGAGAEVSRQGDFRQDIGVQKASV